jgi:2-keto-4-pentenoate hydratase/2-oxohepta-3-ene-1,7-dioic acid hydratase in catechol pathway
MKPTTAVLDPDAAIEIPTSAPDWVDFEAELAVVIGKRARNVAVDDALDYVLGYTVANDVTARDCQKHDKQWPRAKGFDTFCPLGPCLVPSAELDPNDLTVSSTLDGRQMQSASTAAMIFSTAELISYLSHQFTLLPGTLILTGTPEGGRLCPPATELTQARLGNCRQRGWNWGLAEFGTIRDNISVRGMRLLASGADSGLGPVSIDVISHRRDR